MSEHRSRRPLFALVVFVVFFGGAEWWASQSKAAFPSWGAADNPSVVLTGHPTRLWGLTPGKRKNLETVATVGALGLRGDPPTMPRPEGEERVVILGDSTFFGFGVADEHTMAVRLEGKLNNATVLNGGIPGYSTEQTIRLLEEVIWALDPTLLVVANFWSDTSFEPYRDKDLLATQEASNTRLFAHSALVRWLATALSGMRAPDRTRIVTWVHGNSLPPATQRRVTLTDYAANLDQIIRHAAAREVGVLLLTPPSPLEVENKVDPPHQWDSFRETQAQVARHHGIPHVLTTPAFQSAFQEARNMEALFLDDLHPSVAGQDMMATVVQNALSDSGWPKNRLLGTDTVFDIGQVVDSTPPNLQAPPDGNNSPTQNLFVDPTQTQPNGGTQPKASPSQLNVSILGGTAPYTLTVTQEGRTVASARVRDPRSLSLRVPKGAVEVRVEDAAGAVQERRGRAGTEPVGVVFP